MPRQQSDQISIGGYSYWTLIAASFWTLRRHVCLCLEYILRGAGARRSARHRRHRLTNKMKFPFTRG